MEVSIDSTLQMVAETQLAAVISELQALPEDRDGHDAEGGAVVAIDVKTGQILVSASYPSYDPATYFEKYNSLLEAEHNPLINRALIMAYPPGSTYKMIPTIAALENKIISATTEIEDKGVYTKYDGLYLKCMLYSNTGGATHRSINVMEALMFSCNYFYYSIGDSMNIALMDEVAKQFGLGESTGVELEESTGCRANPETKKELHTGSDASWWNGDNLTAAIGQGDNRFTPLQLAVYTATLANKGVRYKATFMNRVVSADYRELLAENKPKVLSKVEMDPATINAYMEGMKMVVNNPNGTAFSQLWSEVPATVAGKTGTAEHISTKSDHGAFVCFAPAADPQIAIAVYVENGGHGSTLTNIARSILLEYFKVGTVSDVTNNENRLS